MKRISYALMFSAVTPAVVAALPPDRLVHFGIHEDPSNPHRPMQYLLSLSISAQSQSGDFIGWAVTNYRITEKAVLGSDTVWDVDSPAVNTADGLWWVEHADPNNPVRGDFIEPAPVVDTAIANDPGDPDLHFDVVGVAYAPPPGGPPYAVTAALDFAFTRDGHTSPDDSGDDEPVDVPDWGSDPSPGAQ